MEHISEYESQAQGKSRIEVFTSPTCPHCPSALSLANEIANERDDVKVVHQNTATNEGSNRASQFQIMSVPTILVKGPAWDEFIGFAGTPSKSKLSEAIDISLGLKQMPNKENKEGFFKRLFSKLTG